MTVSAKEAREIISFYREAGVDTLVGEKPVDRLADDAPPSQPASPPLPARGPNSANRAPSAPGADDRTLFQTAPATPEAAIMAARQAAKSATTLEALRALLDAFEGCMLRSTATQLVFADGNPNARVMFVGEAPGRDEDLAGTPFVGRSGKLLDRMMAAIGLDRSKAYIANIVPWRPPGNRTPTPHESAICLPFIHRQIELVNPDILVCLGGPSAQTLLAIKEGITRSRGRWFSYDTGTREIRALPTFHPAFLLRSPLQKRLAWRDFLALEKALAG
ncbi:MAG: uracil-DNA glycosylase [Hyphomicrobiales bacterium]|nr:uracil-DNA glycosylase [Hyphomicrobiales bacterium]MDE2285620.1 uracil-DNA glycosylase [Hyphomicrobiales bacterium]MDE2374219.1 uracil-DNA glycosylase [Hyphomicrobiales bacterium]